MRNNSSTMKKQEENKTRSGSWGIIKRDALKNTMLITPKKGGIFEDAPLISYMSMNGERIKIVNKQRLMKSFKKIKLKADAE